MTTMKKCIFANSTFILPCIFFQFVVDFFLKTYKMAGESAITVDVSLCSVQRIYQPDFVLLVYQADELLIATGPPLQRQHRTPRLTFARNQIRWTDEDWNRVLFSDQSRYCLTESDRRWRGWGRPGKRYADVWLGNTAEEHTHLVFIENGSLTSHRYITEVSEDHLMPFMLVMREYGIFMHDNAKEYLNEVKN